MNKIKYIKSNNVKRQLKKIKSSQIFKKLIEYKKYKENIFSKNIKDDLLF